MQLLIHAIGSVITLRTFVLMYVKTTIQTVKKLTTVTSLWARWRLNSSASPLLAQPFIQAQIKENIVTGFCERNPHHWYPSQRASNAENVSIWWRHHGISGMYMGSQPQRQIGWYSIIRVLMVLILTITRSMAEYTMAILPLSLCKSWLNLFWKEISVVPQYIKTSSY